MEEVGLALSLEDEEWKGRSSDLEVDETDLVELIFVD